MKHLLFSSLWLFLGLLLLVKGQKAALGMPPIPAVYMCIHMYTHTHARTHTLS